MACLDENAVAELFDGLLSEKARARVVGHLDTCASCRRIVAAVGAEHSGPLSALPDARESTRLGRGASVGRYVIVEPIGAGSMGVVYSAYDPELDRRVAIKRLTAQDSAASESRRRVLAEAKSMARLSHPNVVAVHDVLEAGDATYIAMEFVDGETITRWREGDRSAADTIEIFRQAGEGLAAAHAVGVVHRDFKPDNVLVSADGRARVTDFGLAHVSTASPPSDGDEVRELAGTPRYMAPEVLAGEAATPASDQYSFCYALHESLLGGQPSTGLRRNEERPRSARAGVSFRLRRALLRGLCESPEDRHPSMKDLLAQLQPRRSRGSIAVAIAVPAVALGTWATLTTARPPEPCPRVRLDDVYNASHRSQIATALSPWPSAEVWTRKIDAGLTEYTTAWEAMHADACRATHVRRTQSEAVLDARMACLEDRRRDLVAIVEVLAELSPEAGPLAIDSVRRLPRIETCADGEALAGRAEQEAVPLPIRDALSRLRAMTDAGDYARAAPTAAALQDLVADAPPRAQAEAALARAWLHVNRAQHEPTQAALHQAIVVAEAADADDLRAEALVLSTFVVGYSLARPKEAERIGDQAEAVLRRVEAGPIPRARLWRYRGLTIQRQGRFEDAAAAHRRSVELLADARLTTHPEYPKALLELGNAHRTLRELDLAEQEYREALRVQENTLGEQHPHIANTLHGLGDVLAMRRDHDGALALYERAMQIHRRTFGGDHLYVAGDRLAKAQVYADVGRLQDADRELAAAIEHYRRDAPNDAHHAVALSSLAELRRLQDRKPEALEAQLANVALRRKITPRHPDFAVALHNTAIAYLNTEQPERALPFAEEAATLADAVLPSTHTFVAVCEGGHARALFAAGRLPAAKTAAEEALRRWGQHPQGTQPHERFGVRWTLARTLWELGLERDRATRLAKLAIAEFETQTDPDDEEAAAQIDDAQRWLDARSGGRGAL